MITDFEIAELIKKHNISLFYQLLMLEENTFPAKRSLIRYAKKQINSNRRIRAEADLRFALGLTMIAYNNYKGGNLWGLITNALGSETLSSSRITDIGMMFLKTLEKYKLFIIPKDKNGKNQYVQNILSHAFVPKNYIDSYFEFLYSFYDRNLGRILPDNIDEDFNDLKRYMKNLDGSSDRGEDIIISLGASKNHSGVSYKLLKSTKTVLAEGDEEVIKSVIYNHLKDMEQYFYTNSSEGIYKKFKQWCDQKFLDVTSKHAEFVRDSGFRMQIPFLSLSLRNIDRAFIVIPPRKFKSEIREATYKIVLENEVLETGELELCESLGCNRSELKVIQIPMTDVFKKIKIYCNDESIKRYNASKFRLFKNIKDTKNRYQLDKTEINTFEPEEICILTQKDVEVSVDKNNIIYQNTTSEAYNIYELNIDETSTTLIDGVPYSVKDSSDKEDLIHLFFNEPQNFSLRDKDGRYKKCTYAHPKIFFKNGFELIEKNAFIWCNEEKFNLEKVGSLKVIDSDLNYLIVDMKELVASKIGEYRITLDIPGNSRKEVLAEYIFIEDLEFSTNKKFYINEESAFITAKTSHYILARNSKCTAENRKKFELVFEEDTSCAQYDIELNDIEYVIEVKLNRLKYSFDGRKWYHCSNGYIWGEDLTNYLYVMLGNCSFMEIFWESDSYYPLLPHSEKNSCFTFDISSLKGKLDREMPFKDNLNIRFASDCRINVEKLATIVNAPDIISYKFGYEGEVQSVYLDVEFFGGKVKTGARIRNLRTRQVTKIYLQQGRNYLEDLEKNDIYNITFFFEKQADEFSFFEPVEAQTVTDFKRISGLSPIESLISPNSQIIIRAVYFNGKKLDLKYNYQIAKIRYIDRFDCYKGILYENDMCHKCLYSTKIRFKIVDAKKKQIYIYEDSYGDNFSELCYDKRNKNLEESSKKRTNDYSRFECLTEEETIFDTIIRQKR